MLRSSRFSIESLVFYGSFLAWLALGSSTDVAQGPPPSIEPRISYPSAKQTASAEMYHGIKVADPYHWLEDLEAPETRNWLGAENKLTAAQGLRFVSLDAFRQRIREVQEFRTIRPPTQRGEYLFFVETAGNLGGSSTGGISVYLQHGLSGQSRLVLDSKERFPDGSYELRSISPSKDGKLMVYAVSKTGSRWLQWRVFDIEASRDLPDILASGNVVMSTIAWDPGGKGFFYGRFRTPSGDLGGDVKVEFQQLCFHRIGTPQSADELVLENTQEADRWFLPAVSEDGRHLLVISARGSSGNVELFLRARTSETKRFEKLNPGMIGQYTFLGNEGQVFYFLTDWNAPHWKIVSVRIDLPVERAWHTVVSEADETINHASLVADRFIMQCSKDAAPVFKIYNLNGGLEQQVKMPALGNVWGPPWGPGFAGNRTDQKTFFSLTGLADPGSIYEMDVGTGEIRLWKRPHLRFDPDQFVTEHFIYESKDGTHVPIFIVHKQGFKLNSETPTWLYAYGALAWSSFPWFQPQMVAWIEKGGVFALAGIRGGGEYGESWHQAGIKTNRQHAIDDYLSAAEWLVKSGYTSPKKLVINGGSLSGALPAIALLRRPDLFGAAIVDIPVLDLIRYSKHTGAHMWVSELGSVEDSAEFKSLLAYSPYHNIRAGSCYPSTLITAGSRDETAVPSHAYKFTASLQAAQGCRENPILLQTVEGAGHGFGVTPEQAADTWAFELAFVVHALDVESHSKNTSAGSTGQQNDHEREQHIRAHKH
jgi:prolyl oligopeptidase